MILQINQIIRRVPKPLLYLLGLIPMLWLFAQALLGNLGPDPIDRLEEKYGLWALQFLITTLCISPLRRVGINAMIWRRPLGLLSFFYMLAHLSVWILLDHGLNGARIWEEILKRPFITLGMTAFLIALPLAITSNNAAIRRMGPKKWQRLHRLVYPLAIIAALHFILVVKGWPMEPMIYLAIILGLLMLRFVKTN